MASLKRSSDFTNHFLQLLSGARKLVHPLHSCGFLPRFCRLFALGTSMISYPPLREPTAKPVVYVDAFDQRMQGSTIRFVHATHNGECATAEWEEAAARESGIIFADPTNGAKGDAGKRKNFGNFLFYVVVPSHIFWEGPSIRASQVQYILNS